MNLRREVAYKTQQINLSDWVKLRPEMITNSENARRMIRLRQLEQAEENFTCR
jgi:hypothetical protein